MSEPPRKRLRRGTKSCLDCRRRKTKCTYNTTGKPPCDACLSRKTACQSQSDIVTSGPVRERTRERVDRLEVVVQNLTRTVAELQGEATDTPAAEEATGRYLGENTAEGSLLVTDPDSTASNMTQAGKSLDHGKEKLLYLVPSRDDVLLIMASATDWWRFHNCFLPEPPIKNRIQLIEYHLHLDDCRTSSAFVATWLLCLTISFIQLTLSFDFSSLQSICEPERFILNVSKAVETILEPAEVLESLDGIECVALYAHLQKIIGRPNRGWVAVRRAMTYAELMKLPVAAKEFNSLTLLLHQSDNQIVLMKRRMRIWNFLSGVDQLLSLCVGMPTAVSNVNKSWPKLDSRNSSLQTQQILWIQSGIANWIVRRDRLEDEDDALVETEKIATRMQIVKQSWPVAWPVANGPEQCDPETASSVLMRASLSFLAVRLYLPYLLKVEENHNYVQSATACLHACREILKMYFVIHVRLAQAGFTSQSFDVMVFTASLILLLYRDGVSHHMSATDTALIDNVKMAMDQAPERIGVALTREMVRSIGAIRLCLDGDSASPANVQIKTPLLGEINVERARQDAEHGGANDDVARPASMASIAFDFNDLKDDWFCKGRR